MNHKMSIYKKAVGFAIVALFIAGAFVPANGFILRDTTVSTKPSPPTLQKDINPILILDTFEQTQNNIDISDGLEQKQKGPPQPLNPLDPWWNPSFSYRKEITIDHTKITANLTNFPVLISLSSDVDLAAHTQSDGDDIVFINNATGTKLNHEIEMYNSTGRLVAWINVTNLSKTADTKLYMYYGNSSCGSQQNPKGVWDSNYVSVWHLNEDPGVAGNGGIKDSTRYYNNGTDMGTMNAADHVTGKIGYGIDFDGTDDVIRIDNSNVVGHCLDFTSGPFTIEAWFTARTRTGTIICKRDGVPSNADQYQMYLDPVTNGIYFRAGLEYGYGSDTLSTNTWYYGAAVVDSNEWPNITRDGVLRTWSNTPGAGSPPYVFTHRNVNVSIGARWNTYPATGYLLPGIIDEIRISKINRSSSWLSTSYNNQNNPIGFSTLGSEETLGGNQAPVITSSTPVDGTSFVKLNPTLAITINDPDGDTMNISFKTNATGSWSVIGSNLSIGNGTYQQTPTTMNSYHTKYYWSVNVNDGPKWTNKTYWFKTEPEPGIWWDTNWMYRKRIEISHTQIASNLTNFPVLITFPSDADLATDAQDDGDDLVFTDFNGNQLHHENELFDGVTGKLIIWVNVTSLSHLNDTVVYLYYGNALCDNQQNINGVWKSDYVAVWHLNQDPGVVGTSGILDSTNYSNDGTDMGSMDAADHVIGKIGYGVDFDGTDDVIKIENSWTAGHILDFTNESSFTLEAWFNCRTTTNQGTLINKRDSPTASIHYDQYQFHLQPNPQFRANQEFGGGTDTLGTSTWYYGAAVVTSNGTIGGWPIIYRDGILKTWADNTGTRPYSIIHRNVNVSIGARWAGYPTAGYLFSGVIDEVRISKTNRNSSWLLTCYNNQNNPGGFYIVTPKETGTRPEVPQVTDEVPNNSTTGTILNPLLTVNVIDYQGNTMNVWFKTNASGTWTVIGSNTSVGNGTYRQIPTAMISYNTKYYWSVNVFDGTYWMNKTFWFMTKINYPPVMTNLNPTNGSIGNLISLAQLSITLNDPEGNPITYSITTSPNIGSKSETGINNGTITVDVSGLAYNTTYSWSVKATDSAGSGQWTNNTYWFKTERGPGTWWNTNWAYRKEITIDHTKVATNLTNFPVLIKLSSDADLATDAQDDGDDLVFTEYNTGILNHEIELFNGTTGQLVAWVNSSSLSRTADTILYLYYGNGVVGNQQNPEGVWDIHYKGVWHFNNSILDSTTNNDDGTNYGSTNAIGTIGGSRYFDGNDYITAPQHCIGANQNWTASCWFRSNSTSSMVYHYFFSTGPYTGPTSYGAFQLYHNMNDATYLPIDEVRTRLQDQDSDFSQLYQYGGSAAEDTWHLVHVTWNALTHNFRIYVNGSLVNQSTNAAVTGAGTTLPLYIGARGDLDTQRYHIGSIDEARIISQTKTAGWITTEYNNQYNPSGFSTLGDEEEAPLVNQPPIFSSENPTDNTGILDINIPSVSVLIQDPEGDAFDWTIEGQYVTSAGANGAVNGTKSASLITPLPYITNIIWYVNATDGFEWTREVYNFTTRAQYIPGIPSGFTATAMNRTRIDLSWTKGDKTDKTCIERNLVASWNRGEGTLIYNNTGTNYQDTGLSQNIHYYYQALSWNTTDHVYSTTSAAADATTFANQLPVFSGENPADNTGNIGINTPSVNVLILDPDGDVFDWMIQGQYVTNAGANDASNGTKSASLITPLPFSTNVIWYVNATDGVGWARMVYNFTTRSQYIPSIPSEFTATAMSRTRIDLAWTKGANADMTYIERNLVSFWNRDEGTMIYNNTGTSYSDTSLSQNIHYYYQSWSWNTTDHVYSTTSAAVDATTFANQLPVFSGENPADNTGNIGINTPSVNVLIQDPDGDVFDWMIQGQYITSANANGAVNGTKSANLIIPLPFSTNVIWYVNATDGVGWARMVYNFTTRSQYIPGIPSEFTATAMSRTRINLAWTKGANADMTYIERNLVSSWNRDEGTMIYNNTGTSYSDTSLSQNIHYYYQSWSWNTTDHVWSTTSTAADATTFANHLPTFTNQNPADNAGNIAINTPSVSVLIQDQDADVFNWTIQGQYVTSAGVNGAANGTKSANLIVPLPYNTNIIWYVNATDGTGWTRAVYNFTTAAQSVQYPIVTLLVPANNSQIYRHDVTFNCSASDTTGIKNVSLYTNISGTWHRMETKTPPGYEYNYNSLMELWMHFNKDAAYGETDTHLYDFSGKKHNGTTTGGAVYSSAGKYGGAYSFDGTDDVVTLTGGNYSLSGKRGGTMTAWVKPASGQTSAAGTILFIDRAGTSTTRMLISVNSDRTVSVKGRSAEETLQVCTTTQTIPYDTWSHIVGVINLTSNSMQIYINGVLSKTQTMAFGATTFAISSATNPGIGGIYLQAGFYYKGLIDETAMFPRVLTASEARALYNGSRPTNCTVSFSVTNIPPGTYQWNCLAYNSANSSAWALNNRLFTIMNRRPSISSENPADNAGNIAINTPSVSVLIQDQDADVFNWTIQGQYVTGAGANSASNGTKSANLITPLPSSTNIIWYVNATDGYGWTRMVYNFTTRAQYLPSSPTEFTATAMSRSRIDLAWTKGDKADTTYIERNLISSWNRGEGILIYNNTGTSYQNAGLSPNIHYYYQAWSWNNTDHMFSTTIAASDAATFTNHLPSFSSQNPADNAGNIGINTPSVSVLIQDQDADVFNWTIQGQYVTSAGVNGAANGTKSANLIVPLPYNTNIIWYVNATDGYGWTRSVYNFTTTTPPANYPTVTLITPLNNSIIDHNNVTFNCSITDTTGIKNVSLYTNISGIWQRMETKNIYSGEYSYNPLMELWMHFNKDAAYGETDTHLYDFSGKKHNGTTTGGAVYSSAGKYGGAYSFDGTDDVVTLTGGNYSLSGKRGGTMAAWVKPASGQTSAAGTILFIDRAGTSTTRMLISVNSDRTVSVKGRSAEETLQVCTTTQTIPYDTWSHIVGVINLTSNSMQIYINGVLSKTQTMAFGATTFAISSATNPGIGGIYGVATYNFKGLIDETAMFPRVLTASEARALYNGTQSTSCNVSFQVNGITEGTYKWNCVAYNSGNNSAWAQNNWIFTIMSPLNLQFISPTPANGETINTQTATINVSANRNLSSCVLSLLNDGIDNESFTITLNQAMVDKWGFRYPTTYTFNLTSIPVNAEVVRRNRVTDPWKPLVKKTENDFFNGIECVRFNSSTHKAYVSVGFNTTDVIYLKFLNVSSVTYDSIAKYYDNRKATYTLSNDNWGKISSAHPGATWQGMTNDASDNYQASIHATRIYNIPMSIAINSRMAGGAAMWDRMQDELNYSDYSWEPSIHTRTHPCGTYTNGYVWEILGCRNDILENLTKIPYGQYVFNYILPCGYQDSTIESTSAGEFLFLRDWTGSDHPSSTIYAPWNSVYNFYGIGGLETKAYDPVFEARSPSGRYYASDVTTLNNAFTTVYNNGGIFYAMFHPDRYSNSVIFDTRPGVDGVSGSSFMQHLSFVANRTNVWYVANGWLYSYHYVAENAVVSGGQMHLSDIPMTIVNNNANTYAYHTLTNLVNGTTYQYYVTGIDDPGHLVRIPSAPTFRDFTVRQPSAWWNMNWHYRKEITIDYTKVASNLTNFSILIALASDADLASKTQPDGDDIVFTNSTGSKLSHEIELFNSTTGQLIVWVNVTSLSSTQDTILYLYYGNSACANQENSAGTWASNYRMVQHLSETTGIHDDSTTYGNDGTYHGSNQNAVGIIDGADQFIGDLVGPGDYIDCGNATSLNINSAITVSSWIKPDDQVNWNHLFTKGCNTPNRVYQFSIEANETIDFILNGDTTNAKATTAVSVPINQWSYVTGTYDGSSIKVYINGIERANKAYTNPINTNAVHLFIAGRVNGTGNTGPSTYTFNGLMDEVKLSDNARSAGWILTEYNNQYNPSGFYQMGSEEEGAQLEYIYTIPVQTHWNLISLPFNTSLIKSEINISYNGTTYTWNQAISNNIIIGFLYGWNRTGQSYLLQNTLEPGCGYWMWAYHPCDLVISLDGEYQDGLQITTLQQRWNIIGLPYNVSLAKQNITVQYNGTDFTWQQATGGSTPIILGYIYGWNRATQIYQLSDQLNAGYGYWMYAYHQCVLKT